MSSLPKKDVHPSVPAGTLVKGEILGYDDPNSDARYVHPSRFISGPLHKQHVEEFGYWQYGVRRLDHSGVVMIDPDTLEVVDTKTQARAEARGQG